MMFSLHILMKYFRVVSHPNNGMQFNDDLWWVEHSIINSNIFFFPFTFLSSFNVPITLSYISAPHHQSHVISFYRTMKEKILKDFIASIAHKFLLAVFSFSFKCLIHFIVLVQFSTETSVIISYHTQFHAYVVKMKEVWDLFKIKKNCEDILCSRDFVPNQLED